MEDGFTHSVRLSKGEGAMIIQHIESGDRLCIPVDEANSFAMEMLEILAKDRGPYEYVIESVPEIDKMWEIAENVQEIKELVDSFDFKAVDDVLKAFQNFRADCNQYK